MDADKTTIYRYTIAENINFDITSIGAELFEYGSLYTFRQGLSQPTHAILAKSCASIVNSGTSFTVTFGDTACQDGFKRSGTLIFDCSESLGSAHSFKSPGFTFSVSSVGYKVFALSVDIISKKVTNTSPLSIVGENSYSGVNLSWSDKSVIAINAGATTLITNWNSDKTVTLANTNDTNCYKGQLTRLFWGAAKISLNGTAYGDQTPMPGATEHFNATVTNLFKDFSCSTSAVYHHYTPFISGVINYQPDGKELRHLDYGTGICDDSQVLTIGGYTETVFF